MKTNLLYIILSICSLFSCLIASAQEEILFSQQLFSRINKNPAGTGNYPGINLFLMGRLQYVGIDNAPQTILLNGSGYSEMLKSSFGATLLGEKHGIGKSFTNAKLVYSYHIDLTDKHILSMGVSGGVYHISFDPSEHILRDAGESDETLPTEKLSTTKPDFDLGLELCNETYMIGASIQHLLDEEQTTISVQRHFFLYGRYYVPLSETLDISPALFLMMAPNTFETDLNTTIFYQRMLWGGFTYRPDLNAGFSPAIIAIQVGIEYKNLRFGYGFEFGPKIQATSHELLVSIGLGNE